jgi:hypothetical protein
MSETGGSNPSFAGCRLTKMQFIYIFAMQNRKLDR